MLYKTTRLTLAALSSAAVLFAEETAPAADAAAQTPADAMAAEAAPVELSENELNEMMGYITALSSGIATLQLESDAVDQLATGLISMLREEIDLRTVPQQMIQTALGEAQARAEAVQAESADLPGFSEGALQTIGMVLAQQSGILQLGFGADEADAIRRGFVEGATATELPADFESKMPAFDAFINERIQTAQAAMQAEQEAAREAAMAEFKEVADEWSARENINVVLETTQGEVEIELYPSEAPLAVANFVGHIESGYYDDLTFHRVIDGFMIQGGDPQGTGAGGQSIWGKPFPDEFSEELRFDQEGLLAMANSGPMTNGSQFFITTSEPNWLNDKHTIFGKVVDGYDHVKAIEKTETDAQDRPVETQKIVKAYVKD